MRDTLRVFIGYDERQPLAYCVAQHSVARHCSVPVAVTPLILKTLPIKRRGLTQFTFSRFLVPWLCDYRGTALFMDADMVVTGDVAELFECADAQMVVHVMQKQERFEWPSVMLFNNYLCNRVTPEYIDDERNQLFDFAWARDRIGSIPNDWNAVVGYGPVSDSAKLLHWTRGLPVWKETQDNGGVDTIWFNELEEMNYTCQYRELMGNSIHAERTRNVAAAHQ